MVFISNSSYTATGFTLMKPGYWMNHILIKLTTDDHLLNWNPPIQIFEFQKGTHQSSLSGRPTTAHLPELRDQDVELQKAVPAGRSKRCLLRSGQAEAVLVRALLQLKDSNQFFYHLFNPPTILLFSFCRQTRQDPCVVFDCILFLTRSFVYGHQLLLVNCYVYDDR